jgi:hypothetical protein
LNVKKALILALLVALMLPAATAGAQVFGQYTPAEILPINSRLGGAYADFSENVVGLLGQLRLSFYPNIDFGFQGGLSRLDTGGENKTSLRLGGDLRFGVVKAGAASPVDVAVGGGLGIETSDNYHLLRLGPSAVASRSFGFSPSASVAPYAGVMLCFASLDVGGSSETDFSVPIRVGAELRPMPGLRITAELQLRVGDDFNDHSGFSAGVNLPF